MIEKIIPLLKITIASALCFWLGVQTTNPKVREMESKLTRISGERDSLNSELFIRNTIITRYEITHDWLKETDPNTWHKVEDWMSKNTE